MSAAVFNIPPLNHKHQHIKSPKDKYFHIKSSIYTSSQSEKCFDSENVLLLLLLLLLLPKCANVICIYKINLQSYSTRYTDTTEIKFLRIHRRQPLSLKSISYLFSCILYHRLKIFSNKDYRCNSLSAKYNK